MHQINLSGRPEPVTVGKIICLARNYVAHAEELGNEVPSAPVVFIKPASSIIGDGDQVEIPGYSNDCHYEVELAVLIGKQGKNIPAAAAMNHVAGYGIAIDMTLRDTQNQLKEKGYPWEIAKGFDTSCPLSTFVSAEKIADPHNLGIRLSVNNELRQDSTTACMIRRIPEIIEFITTAFTLEEGDIILTGTPAGVGRVESGDQMDTWIENIGELRVGVK